MRRLATLAGNFALPVRIDGRKSALFITRARLPEVLRLPESRRNWWLSE
jgi:hypothetical protein